MLTLSNKEPFARGGRRLCFVHPEDDARCVKVLRTDGDRFRKTGRTFVPGFLRREYDNNEDERRALDALQRRLGSAYDHLPRCYGYVETDLGRGLVLELVRDEDGHISRSVRESLLEGVALDELRPAYDEMAAFYIEHGVVTRAILDHNLTAQRVGSAWRLTLIDGFGDSTLIPLRSLLASTRRATAKKRMRAGWERIEEIAAQIRAGDTDWDRSRWGQGVLEHRGAAQWGGTR